VFIRAAGNDRKLNLRILMSLIHELRVKLDIAKAGLAPEKTMRQIDFGVDESTEIFGKGQ